MLVGMRDAPFWPTLEQAAHTLVYDTKITSSLPLDRVSAIITPVLVLASRGSDERLPTWGRWLRDTLPDASLRTLEGEWHGVAPEVLAPELTEFFTSVDLHVLPRLLGDGTRLYDIADGSMRKPQNLGRR
jgi:hypothetical protein